MTASGSALGIQTWDWHNELADGWMVWTIEHPDGRRVETLTEAGIVGKIGMNDRGVAILLNILGHRDDGPPVGIPVHVLCRSVLDQADGAVTALELIAAADVSASSAITVVTDEDGGTVCTVEVSPAGPGFVTPDDRGVVVHTNHFVERPGRDGDTAVREAPGTILRLDLAKRRMAAMRAGEVTPAAVLAAMSSHRGGASAMCCHPEPGAALRRPVDDARNGGRRARASRARRLPRRALSDRGGLDDRRRRQAVALLPRQRGQLEADRHVRRRHGPRAR